MSFDSSVDSTKGNSDHSQILSMNIERKKGLSSPILEEFMLFNNN